MITMNPTYRKELDNETLQRIAPSIFATEPWTERSDRYKFIPTVSVLDAMRDSGYFPVYAGQSRTRIEGKKEFTKHTLRLRHRSLETAIDGEIVPEIVLINSHDGSKAYNLMLGFFRTVCCNGLITGDMLDNIRVPHRGQRDLCQDVIDVSARIIEEVPGKVETIHSWKSIELHPEEQTAFATASKALLDTAVDVPVDRLLRPRRNADNKPDLWTTFNRVQENIIKGGQYGRNSQGYITRSREIKAIDKNTSLNKALWNLADEMAKIKS